MFERFFKIKDVPQFSVDLDSAREPLRPTSIPDPLGEYEEDPDPEVTAAVMTMAAMLIAELDVEEIQRGRKYTPEERAAILNVRGQRATLEWMQHRQDLSLAQDAQSEVHAIRTAMEEVPDHIDQLVAQAPLARVSQFWHDHPFISGVIGASIVQNLKRRR